MLTADSIIRSYCSSISSKYMNPTQTKANYCFIKRYLRPKPALGTPSTSCRVLKGSNPTDKKQRCQVAPKNNPNDEPFCGHFCEDSDDSKSNSEDGACEHGVGVDMGFPTIPWHHNDGSGSDSDRELSSPIQVSPPRRSCSGRRGRSPPLSQKSGSTKKTRSHSLPNRSSQHLALSRVRSRSLEGKSGSNRSAYRDRFTSMIIRDPTSCLAYRPPYIPNRPTPPAYCLNKLSQPILPGRRLGPPAYSANSTAPLYRTVKTVSNQSISPVCLGVEEDSRVEISTRHYLVGSSGRKMTVQLCISSQKPVCLYVYNQTLIYNEGVSLANIHSDGKMTVTVNASNVPDDFYQTGLIAVLQVESGRSLLLTYQLVFNCSGRYVDRVLLKGKCIESISSEIKLNPSLERCETRRCLKLGLKYRQFGKDLSIKDGDFEMSFTDWVNKPCYQNVYLGFEYQVKTVGYRVIELYGLTGDNVVVPLDAIDSYDSGRFGTVKSQIGREFDGRDALCDAKVNKVVRFVVFCYESIEDIVKPPKPCPPPCPPPPCPPPKPGPGPGPKPTPECPPAPPICYDGFSVEELYDEIDLLICKLQLLKANILNDGEIDHPSAPTVETAKGFCRALAQAKYLEGIPLSNPVVYILTYNKTVLFKEKVVAKDQLGEYSICCLTDQTCEYVESSSDSITYAMAVARLENLLRYTKTGTRNPI